MSGASVRVQHNEKLEFEKKGIKFDKSPVTGRFIRQISKYPATHQSRRRKPVGRPSLVLQPPVHLQPPPRLLLKHGYSASPFHWRTRAAETLCNTHMAKILAFPEAPLLPCWRMNVCTSSWARAICRNFYI